MRIFSAREPLNWLRGLCAFAVYLSIVVLAGIALACFIHSAFDTEPARFHKLMLRCIEVVGLGGVACWLRGQKYLTRAAWGLLGPWRGALADIGLGIALGLAMVTMAIVALVWLGERVFLGWPSGALALELVAKGLVLGVLVASLEELWFRGGLYGALERGFASGWAAVIVSSVFFSSVHFIRPTPFESEQIVTFFGGLQMFAGSFVPWGELSNVGSALALALAGGVLGVVRLRTGRVLPCVAIHAGWVGALYTGKKLTEVVPTASQGVWGSQLAGSYDGVVGAVAGVIFALVLVVLMWSFEQYRSRTARGAGPLV
ncbi:MAG: membrane protease YdiL (CAAX protease family) [Gammaproteobacteria bacterium]